VLSFSLSCLSLFLSLLVQCPGRHGQREADESGPRPARPSARKVVISVSIQEGEKTEKTQWITGQASAKLADGKRMLTVILAPESWKGYAFLVWEPENEPKAMWRYLPALRKLTRLTPAGRVPVACG
jgi:hypothetical protein